MGADPFGGRAGGAVQPEREVALVREADLALAPAGADFLPLVGGQGVEELVRHEQDRLVWQRRHIIMVGGPHTEPGQHFGLFGAQGRAGFHQMHVGALGQRGFCAQDAPDVRHQRSPAGAQLHQRDGQGAPKVPPSLQQPGADQFAEQLADLRGGGEVAVRAQRVAGCVVTVPGVAETQRHVAAERNRPLGGDHLAQDALKRCHFHAGPVIRCRCRSCCLPVRMAAQGG